MFAEIIYWFMFSCFWIEFFLWNSYRKKYLNNERLLKTVWLQHHIISFQWNADNKGSFTEHCSCGKANCSTLRPVAIWLGVAE